MARRVFNRARSGGGGISSCRPRSVVNSSHHGSRSVMKDREGSVYYYNGERARHSPRIGGRGFLEAELGILVTT